MAVVCAISGVPPEEPVVSVKSGFVFEKRLVIKHLKQAGTCPMTKEELRPEDLLPLKVNTAVKPRPASASSIPGMLQVFQNEWDAVMLETHTLKQHLEHLRQELAHTLYKHDAACRVIARLVKERDDAKRALGATESNIASAIRAANAPAEAEPMEGVEGQGAHPQLPVQDAGKINEFAAELSKSRKGVRKAREAKVNPREKVQAFKQAHTYSLHSTSTPGVTALDLHAANHDLAVTGGADGNVIVFNLKTGKNVDTLSKGPHKKRITDVAFHPTEEAVVSTSADGSAAVWRRGDKGKFPCLHTFNDHKSEITGLSMHPCGDYFATAGADRSWALYDIKEGKSLLHVSDKKVEAGFSASAFHPDGILFGLGSSDSIVRIYDLNDTSKGIQPLTGHSGTVSSVTFSENGYHVASADDQGVVKIWDLRKLAVLQTITVSEGPIKRLAYDLSGNYLAVGGQGVNVYGTKDWEVIAKFSDHKDIVNSVKFGPDASFLASVSSDRTLKIFS